MTPLLAPSSAKIRRERSPRRTLSADSIAQGSRRSPPDGGTPQSLPHRFQISQFAGATLASPEVQLASQQIRRVQFSVNAIPVRLHFRLPDWQRVRFTALRLRGPVRLALALLEDLGGGIILYLAQEARRLGLANKMRTYQSQDDGLDTFDANTTLGFDDDERDYSIAACMLRMLYRTRIGPHERSGQAKRSHKGRIEIASRCRSRRRSMPTTAV
jgi:GTP cyclohydrolase II